MKHLISLIFCAALCMSCGNQSKKSAKKKKAETSQEMTVTPAQQLARTIERTHHKKTYDKFKAIRFELHLTYNGEEDKTLRVSFLVDQNKIKVEKLNTNTTLIYNGEASFLFPKSEAYPKAYRDLWTWASLFSLPFNLPQSNAALKEKSHDKFQHKRYQTMAIKLDGSRRAFEQPWLTLYSSSSTNFLSALRVNKPNQNLYNTAQAVVYKSFFSLERVPMAKYWDFYHWNSTKGIYGDRIGRATLSKVTFFNPPKNFFHIPNDALLLEKQTKEPIL